MIESNRLSSLDRTTGSPVSSYGYLVKASKSKSSTAVYDGRILSSFLASAGGNPKNIKEFLSLNKLGPFEIEPGDLVKITLKGN